VKITLDVRSERPGVLGRGSVLSPGLPGTGEAMVAWPLLVGELLIDGVVLRLYQALRCRPDKVVGATAPKDCALGLGMTTLDGRGGKGAVVHDIHDGLYRYTADVE
jgi:hypothetical protein